jgi:protease-4
MSLDPDVIVDRRRLKRKIGFWRIIAFVAVAVALIVAIMAGRGVQDLVDKNRPHIARITIQGFIAPDRKLTELIEKVAKDDHVKGVIVAIDSPGGATTGGEAIYEALRKLSAAKPTTAYVSSLAASAGYLIALGTDHIVARRNAITGSIGVLVQWGDVSALLDKVGVKFEEVKSTPLKAEPNPFKPASPEAKAMLDRMIRDSYEWFVGLVAERRGLTPERAHELADGRVVTGHQAVDLKLVDAMGGEETAKTWLESKGLPRDLPVHDWKPRRSDSAWPLAESAAAAVTRGVLSALGLDGLAAEAGSLDGLMSVWHLGRAENARNSGGIAQ